MTPERWQVVKSLFAAAVEQPSAERERFLERESGGDDELRREVESLLAAAEGSDSMPRARAAIASMASQVREPALHTMLSAALGQQYEIVRSLGQGGMGAVYLAREKALERFVAIKVLRPELAEAHAGRERFRREARIAAQLSHPGILPLHTFGEVGGLWYFVMSYVRGVSLEERLRVEERVSSSEAHRILLELADALECAHRSGVVHRDIKPANVMLDEDTGRAMLTDFGISKVRGTDTLTATGVAIGTPSYMSPEQASGSHDVDERSDIYSLGALGYTMLAGREPYPRAPRDAPAGAGTLADHRTSQAPPPLHVVAPSVPADLAAVVMRCLARDPASRWPTARALKDALRRTGAGEHGPVSDSLRELPAFGPYALLWALVFTALAIRPLRSAGDRALLMLVALLVPIGFLIHLWNDREEGIPPLEMARVAFWPPEWWGMWWPKALRRPFDLWPRLPLPARLVRSVMSAFIVALPALILMRDWVTVTVGAPSAPLVQPWFVVAEWLLIVVAGTVVAGTLGWALRRGLTWRQALRLAFGATMPSPAWHAPALARVLLPPGGGVRAPLRDSAGDHVRAIEELATRLPSVGGNLASEVPIVARRLAESIARDDAEIARIDRDANAGETDRLSAQLAALESDAGELPERRELAALVRDQLEVMRRMQARCEATRDHRTRRLTLLRGLWSSLSLACEADVERVDPVRPMERLRAICVEAAAMLDEPGPRAVRAVV